MARSYRTLQHWNQWLAQHFLGQELLVAEEKLLGSLLARHFGKHALLLGVPKQIHLLSATAIPCHTLTTPLICHEKAYSIVESDFHELPFLTGSIDLAILPHTLEFVDNPRQLLTETCRIIKPEGLIVITGFNPYSIWGLKQLFSNRKEIPWKTNFIQAQNIKNWLQLADFAMEKHLSTLFRPPITHPNLFRKLGFFELIGEKCFPILGGSYMIMARAKVIPLTPIKMKWKQQLSGIRISTTIPGNLAHQDKHK